MSAADSLTADLLLSLLKRTTAAAGAAVAGAAAAVAAAVLVLELLLNRHIQSTRSSSLLIARPSGSLPLWWGFVGLDTLRWHLRISWRRLFDCAPLALWDIAIVITASITFVTGSLLLVLLELLLVLGHIRVVPGCADVGQSVVYRGNKRVLLLFMHLMCILLASNSCLHC